MSWSLATDLTGHRAAVEGFLAAEPVEHTSQATILANLAAGVSWSDAPPVLAQHRAPDGAVDGAAVLTPPYELVLDGPADPDGLARTLDGVALPGVNAPEPVAEAFAAAWSAARGVAVRPRIRLHLLELTRVDALVTPPATGTGRIRVATPEDLPAVLALVDAMRAEIMEGGTSPARIQEDRIAAGLVWVHDRDGDLLATAQTSLAAAGVSRVAGVYTVPAQRGRGLAAGVTAAVTRAAFAAGARQLCLFTDAANATSNGVYERLGYRRRPHDRVALRFDTG